MSILPAGATLATEDGTQPSRTYRIDFGRGRVVGMTDGIEAIRQAVYKIIDTERFAHMIYSGNYGREHGPASELQGLITEALLQDDRITDIEDFQLAFGGGTADSAVVAFTVVTIYGAAPIERRTGVYV